LRKRIEATPFQVIPSALSPPTGIHNGGDRMPIDRDDFNKGKKIYEMAEDLRAFLGEHPNKAYTYGELVKAIGSLRLEDDLVFSDPLVHAGPRSPRWSGESERDRAPGHRGRGLLPAVIRSVEEKREFTTRLRSDLLRAGTIARACAT
jgi:hypothetical protein